MERDVRGHDDLRWWRGRPQDGSIPGRVRHPRSPQRGGPDSGEGARRHRVERHFRQSCKPRCARSSHSASRTNFRGEPISDGMTDPVMLYQKRRHWLASSGAAIPRNVEWIDQWKVIVGGAVPRVDAPTRMAATTGSSAFAFFAARHRMHGDVSGRPIDSKRKLRQSTSPNTCARGLSASSSHCARTLSTSTASDSAFVPDLAMDQQVDGRRCSTRSTASATDEIASSRSHDPSDEPRERDDE